MALYRSPEYQTSEPGVGPFFYPWAVIRTSQLDAPVGFSVQEKRFKIDFQEGNHGSHLGFPIRMILAIFDPQVTPILPIKFRVNLSFGSGVEVQIRLSRWRLWRPSIISHRNNFSYFLSLSHPKARIKFFQPIGLTVQDLKFKIDFQDGDHLGFPIDAFFFFFFYFISTGHLDTSNEVSSQLAFRLIENQNSAEGGVAPAGAKVTGRGY